MPDSSFIDRFNEALGNATGRRLEQPRPIVYSDKARRTAGRSSRAKVTRGAKRGGKSRFKQSAVPKLSDEAKQEQSKGFLDKISDSFNPFDGDFARSIPGRGLDILSRPGYGLFEAMRNVSESVNAGEPVWSLGDDAVTGAWKGLSGQKKTGYGQVVEENAERGFSLDPMSLATNIAAPFTAVGQGFDAWDKFVEDNDIPLPKTTSGLDGPGPLNVPNARQALGFAGEVGLDPINLVGGKTISVLKHADGAKVIGATTDDIGEAIAKKVAQASRDASTRTGNKLRPKNVKITAQGGHSIINGHNAVAQQAWEAAQKAILEIQGGPQGGKVLFGPGHLSGTVANVAGEARRTAILQQFEKHLESFKTHLSGGTQLNSTQFQRMMQNAQFRHFFSQWEQAINKGRSANPINSFADLQKALHNPKMMFRPRPSHLDKAADAARATIADDIIKFQDDVVGYVEGMVQNVPGVRVGGKVIPFERVGRAYHGARKAISKKFPGASDMGNKLSYSKQFPGRMSLISQKIKGMGIKAYDDLHAEAKKYADNLTRQQQRALQDALEKGVEPLDPNMNAAYHWLRSKHDEMFDEEVSMGLRTATSAKPSNYVYVFNKGGKTDVRSTFKNKRKEFIRTYNSTKGYEMADARKLGLKPEENAFNALLYRKMKSNRDLTKAWFKDDLLDHYGIQARRMSPEEATKRGLEHVSKLPEHLANKLPKGSHWYLPKDVKKVLDTFEKLSSFSSDELGTFLRHLDLVTNKFKALATIPFPAFHVRNMLGDIFMGWMDGVKYSDYNEVITKILKYKGGRPTSFVIRPGWNLSYDEFMDLYKKNAASGGFYAADIDVRPSSRVVQKARDISEGREDLGRLAHFLHALREEASHTSNIDKAVEQAVFRVNKYKFDYGALTKTEREVLKRVFPFYTYSRKAIPALIESLFLNPRHVVQFNKLISDDNELERLMVPQWRREIGYAVLPGEENEKEPWGWTSDFGPTATLGMIDFGDPSEFSRSIMRNVNPVGQLLPELALRKQFFNDKPIYNFRDYLESKLPPYVAFDRAMSTEKGLLEQLLSERWGLGVGVQKLSEGEQEFAANERRDRLIDNPFKSLNYELRDKGIFVYLSNRNDGISIRVKDLETGQVLGETDDPQEAMEFARHYAQQKSG